MHIREENRSFQRPFFPPLEFTLVRGNNISLPFRVSACSDQRISRGSLAPALINEHDWDMIVHKRSASIYKDAIISSVKSTNNNPVNAKTKVDTTSERKRTISFDRFYQLLRDEHLRPMGGWQRGLIHYVQCIYRERLVNSSSSRASATRLERFIPFSFFLRDSPFCVSLCVCVCVCVCVYTCFFFLFFFLSFFFLSLARWSSCATDGFASLALLFSSQLGREARTLERIRTERICFAHTSKSVNSWRVFVFLLVSSDLSIRWAKVKLSGSSRYLYKVSDARALALAKRWFADRYRRFDFSLFLFHSGSESNVTFGVTTEW